ncbi:DUF7694 domain-containing protein [Methylocystis sp. S23]
MNPAIGSLPRAERRHLLNIEAKRRKSGDWPIWETIELPNGISDHGWGSEIRRVHRNWVFSVLERKTDGATHLAISSLSGIRPSFHEMQRIKNELAGADATGVEVYPPQAQMVDQADMFHLWIVKPLPFTIFEGRK